MAEEYVYTGLGEDPNKDLATDQFKINRSFTVEAPTATALAGDIANIEEEIAVSETGIAGEAVAIGEIVYLKTTDGKWWLAKADAEATSEGQLGIALSAGDAEDEITVQTKGDYVTTGLTVGRQYVSAATAGELVTTAPAVATNVVRLFGYAVSTTTMRIVDDFYYRVVGE